MSNKPQRSSTRGMVPCRQGTRRSSRHIGFLVLATAMLSLEPSFSLVVLSLGLSALAMTWMAMLVWAVAKEILLHCGADFVKHRSP